MIFSKPKPAKTKQPRQIERLLEMLQTRRPAGTPSINRFIDDFIDPVCGKYGGYIDTANNYIVKIGKNPTVLWSCHTDTVHNLEGLQKITVKNNMVVLSVKEKYSNCLGADCTTGVWLMLEMVSHGIEGLYIFHDSEEIGGKGSNHIAYKTPEILAGITYAIAFDRKGTNSIISHQCGSRCCSSQFIDSLANLLPKPYTDDATGTFTDTANYSHLIPECSNISVGYYNQHTSKESQSIDHALLLRGAMLQFDATKLVCHRNPPDCVDPWIDFNGHGMGWNGSYRDSYAPNNSWKSLRNYVQNNPDIIADFLIDSGYDVDYFQNYYKY